MEKFYDLNYHNFQICEIENYHEEKVWNIQYDDVFDLLYVFVAKIKRLDGDKKTTFTQPSPHSSGGGSKGSPQVF